MSVYVPTAELPSEFGNPAVISSLAGSLVTAAENFAASLLGISLTAPVINPNFPTVASSPIPVTAPLPALQQVAWTVPTQPGAFTGSLDLSGLMPGSFTGVAPTLSFPSPPTPFSGVTPSPPTVDLNFTYPTPSITLPSPPTLMSLDTVVFNPIVIPPFNATLPTLTAVAPDVIPYVEGPRYTSALLTQLETDLINALQEGTWTGLPGPVEQAMWDRAREREMIASQDAIDELERMEALGYMAPPGVYMNARIKIQTDLAYKTMGLSREIMIKQAELTLENITKAREEAVKLEYRQIQYANEIAQRSFEAVKYATQAAIEIYNAKVQAYIASLKGFESQAMVYDTQIKGLLAQVEVFKAEIAFEQTKAEINTALVQQYKIQVEAAEAILQVYNLELQIVQTQANVEKIKVEIYGEQIKAFVGQINAYTAQIEAFKTQTEAQGVIESVYKTSVDAYAAEVNAQVSVVQARIAEFRAKIDAYTAQLEGFKASVQGMIGQAQAASAFNTATADVYRAEVAAIDSYNGSIIKEWEAVINEQMQVTQIGVTAAKANGDLYIAERGLAMDASKVGAQVNAQLGAAALGAIHFANSASWSSSVSGVQSQSETTSV